MARSALILLHNRDQGVWSHYMRIPSGGSGAAVRARIAANEEAFEQYATSFAIYEPVAGGAWAWNAYKVLGRSRELLKEFPTQEAAEMWMRMRG